MNKEEVKEIIKQFTDIFKRFCVKARFVLFPSIPELQTKTKMDMFKSGWWWGFITAGVLAGAWLSRT